MGETERSFFKNTQITITLLGKLAFDWWTYLYSPYGIEENCPPQVENLLNDLQNIWTSSSSKSRNHNVERKDINTHFKDITLKLCMQVMGNTQAKPAANAVSTVDKSAGNSSADDGVVPTNKTRRGTRVKVFGRFTQKKTPKEQLTPVSTATTAATPSLPTSPTFFNFDDVDAESNDKMGKLSEQQLQLHAAVIRQLEYKQLNFNEIDDADFLFSEMQLTGASLNDGDVLVLKDMSSSSDSLFTDPLSPRATTTTSTNDNQSIYAAHHSWRNNFINNNNNIDDAILLKENKDGLGSYTTFSKKGQQYKQKQERPLSIFSTTSYDTSGGILSPTTARAAAELQRRHLADKLSELSITNTAYLEIPPSGESALVSVVVAAEPSSPENTETSEDGPHELMALQLCNKLTQLTTQHNNNNKSNNSCSIITNTDDMNNIIENNNVFAVTNAASTTDIFNVSKSKKIELKNLSACLTASPLNTVSRAATNNNISSIEEEHSTLSHAGEAQDIILSGNLALQAFASTGVGNGGANGAGGEEEMAPTTLLSAIQMSSPIATAAYSPSNTPSSNVLKKVASFTIEKATVATVVSGNGNGMPTGSTPSHADNYGHSRRLSYVPEKLSFAAYEKFEGQMLMKWLLLSYQSTNTHNNSSSCVAPGNLHDQELNAMTAQYCSNLMKIGVLKQISEKNDEESFSPYNMYQWAHTEPPTTSLPLTPGRLDKASVWPYCSTPTGTNAAGTRIAPKSVQGDVSTYSPMGSCGIGGSQLLQELRRRLLACATINEVHSVIEEFLSGFENHQRRPSKRCIQLSELLNSSEAAANDIDIKKQTAAATVSSISQQNLSLGGIEKRTAEDVSVQTELHVDKLCCLCGNDVKEQTTLNLPNTNAEIRPLSLNLLPPPPPPPPPLPCSINSSSKPPNQIGFPPPPPPPAPLSPPLSGNNITVNTPKPSPSTPPTPAPLPNPAECGWFQQGNNLRKHAVNPPKPMKPLYWTRIVTPIMPVKTTKTPIDAPDSVESSPEELSEYMTPTPKEIWQEIEETSLDNIDEFTELFSRQAQAPISKPKNQKEVRSRTIKVLDRKRSQTVGIVARSLHVDFYEIEHAIYHVDTSVVSLETLQQIINIKATDEELEKIKEESQNPLPLDYPEQFLLKISQISMSTERISCIVFQAEFEEITTFLSRKLEIVNHLSHYVVENEDLKLVFSIILTLGNYMNGGNRSRGQADGFTLEILGKLKDVKSKESHITLLHFIVRTYIARRRKEGIPIIELKLPIPEPSDVERATQVDFDDIKKQITELHKKLKSCKNTTDVVIKASTEKTLQPFKNKMEEFIGGAFELIDKLYTNLEECRELFIESMRFYHFMPKARTLEESTPDQFYECWTNFTNDFKDIWKKELAFLYNEITKKTKQSQLERQRVKTTKRKTGGLKERIMRLSKKD